MFFVGFLSCFPFTQQLAKNEKPSRIPQGEDAGVFLDSMPVYRSCDSSVMWETQN